MQGGQVWAATLVLTFAGIAFVIVVAVLALRYLSPLIGAGTYVVLFGLAAAVSVLIGYVVRWLAQQ